MLVSIDIPSDPVLRQLPEVTSPAVMRALFAVCVEPGWTLRRLRVRNIRYRPHESCLLAYQLSCTTQQKPGLNVVLHARAFAAGAAPEAFRTRPPLATPVGRVPSFLPQADLALWRFPDDPGLLGASSLWHRGAALFEEKGILDVRPWSRRRPRIEVSLERYVPSERCVLRYQEAGDPTRFFRGKVYDARTDAAAAYEQACELWDWSRTHALELQLPRPLGCHRRLNAVWYEGQNGRPFLPEIASVDLPSTMRKVAAALASLHRSVLRPTRRLLVADAAADLERTRDTLLRFYPRLEREITGVVQPLLDAPLADVAEPRPLHGNFHCNQVQLVGRRVAFRDIDQFSLGDPLLDVARFLARFSMGARGRIAAGELVQAQNAFVSTYEILVPWRLDRDRLRWWLTAALLNHQVLKGVRRLAGRETEVAALLQSAQAAVAALLEVDTSR